MRKLLFITIPLLLCAQQPTNTIPQASSTYALSVVDIAATAATTVKATAGNVWGWYGFNPNTSTCYLQFYNTTTGNTSLGTNALHPFGIPTGAAFNVSPGSLAWFNFSTAITTGQTTTATGSTQCTTAMTVTIMFQ
jgi:hypothetical protein